MFEVLVQTYGSGSTGRSLEIFLRQKINVWVMEVQTFFTRDLLFIHPLLADSKKQNQLMLVEQFYGEEIRQLL